MSVTFTTAVYREDPTLGTVLDTTVEPWDAATAVNMANQNARAVLLALGLDADEDLSGSATADDLTARAVLALATDTTVYAAPTVDLQRPGRARWIECGRDATYVAERLRDLLALADHARAHDWLISWG